MRAAPHLVTINTPAVGETSDEEGVAIEGAATSVTVRGRGAMLSAREAFRAQQFAENVSAVVRVEPGTNVTEESTVEFGTDAPEELQGTWAVGAVLHTYACLRVFLRRTET